MPLTPYNNLVNHLFDLKLLLKLKMTVNPFVYIVPNSMDEVFRFIRQNGIPELMGNQASVLPYAKREIQSTGLVAAEKNADFTLKLQEVNFYVIDATLTYADLASHIAAKSHRALKNALAAISDLHLATDSVIRYAFDNGDKNPHCHVLAALMALDAELRIVGAATERLMPIATFYQLGGVKGLLKGERIEAIHLPNQEKSSSDYEKMSFLEGGRTICGLAVVLTKAAGVVSHVRVVLTGCVNLPVRLEKVMDAMLGAKIDSEQIEVALEKVEEEVLILQNELAIHEAYLRHLIKVMLKKAIYESIRYSY
jgi:CO/xanthine dehydrogenase FAD-binding subunit